MKYFVLTTMLVLSSLAGASLVDCQDVYVGRIWVERGVGLKAVKYLNDSSDSAGSEWSYFTGWSADERKEALSSLLTAKASRHRISVATESENYCGIQDSTTVTIQVILSSAS